MTLPVSTILLTIILVFAPSVGASSCPNLLDAYQVIGTGRLSIGHRPRFKDIGKMAGSGINVLVTILGEGEGAAEIGQRAQAAGMRWFWLDLKSARLSLVEEDSHHLSNFVRMSLCPLFQDEGRNFLYLHCSAGIHRTGMVTYALLRALGFSRGEARARLRDLRPITASEVGDDRLEAIDKFVVENFKASL